MQSRYDIDGGYELVFQPDCAELRQGGLLVASSRDRFSGVERDIKREIVRILKARQVEYQEAINALTQEEDRLGAFVSGVELLEKSGGLSCEV